MVWIEARKLVALAFVALPTCAAIAEDAASSAEKGSATGTANESHATGSATITYLTSSSVYIDAGSNDGLAAGGTAEVIRSGEVVASLRVEHLSTRKASCVALSSTVDLEVGDEVRFVAEELFTAASDPAADAAPAGGGNDAAGWLRSLGFRGRIGARYLALVDRIDTGVQNLSQPALDVRLAGKDINGSPWDLNVDVRTRRTYRNSSDNPTTEEGRSRVYRAAIGWHPHESLYDLNVGRLFSNDLPTLSVFDGGTATVRWTHLSLGMLSGTQPDPIDYGYSTQIREHAAFLRLSESASTATRWYLSSGIIGSYDGGEINREYLHMQGSLSASRLSFYFSQDLDFHRGWKQEAEGTSNKFTNSHVNARVRLTDGASIHTGYDNRRNIRLYRDYESPETEFDDSYRQGYWGGYTQRIRRFLRVGVDARRSTGGYAGDANSYTMNLSTQARIHTNVRGTYFENQLTHGWLSSGSLGAQLGSSFHAEIGGGSRDDSSDPSGNTVRWLSAALDYALGRHWYLSVATEHSRDGDEIHEQYYASTNYRF